MSEAQADVADVAEDLVVPAGRRLVGETLYMVGARGELMPEASVKPAVRLQDDTARDLFDRAAKLSAELKAFKAWAFDLVDTYVQLSAERYGVTAAGAKGNMTLYTFDGLIRIVVQRANHFRFTGTGIQTAKELIVDQLLPEWSVGANVNLVAVVQNAFRVDGDGNLNRYAILSLRQLEVDDDRWRRAMEAIAECETMVGSSRYIRFSWRADAREDGDWKQIPLNLATV